MDYQQNPAQDSLHIDQEKLFRRNTACILLLILAIASQLRLVNLGQSPPGLTQDEAANAWNAYSLLKTGKDQVGKPWPIFYMHALGGNRATLHIYLLLPFQAIGGLNIFTTRLLGATGGIFAVFVIYFVAKRLFNRKTALTAAALLALNPWHLQQSRWGQDGALGALLGVAPLALMLWARLPITDDNSKPPKPLLAALAGALAGICCYGYHAVRILVPTLLIAVTLVTLPIWYRRLKDSKTLLAVMAFIITFAATFGPLAYQHLTDPDGIGKRAQTTCIWDKSDPITEKISIAATRYIRHFGPDFLFVHGDHYRNHTPPDIGQFHWYMLPLMFLGLVVLLRKFKSSPAARVLLVYVLLYPIGDCFSKHLIIDGRMSLHGLRSSPGLCALVLLAAVGAVSTLTQLRQRSRPLAITAIAVFTLTAIGLNARYLRCYFGEYNRRPEIYHAFHSDLVEACQWLRPRFDDYDAVFCTTKGMNQPYIISLVNLGYDPHQWFRQPREFITPGEFDIYTRYGKMHFMYGKYFVPAIEKLKNNGKTDNVIFIVRPGELGLKIPIHTIRRPDGKEVLWICQTKL